MVPTLIVKSGGSKAKPDIVTATLPDNAAGLVLAEMGGSVPEGVTAFGPQAASSRTVNRIKDSLVCMVCSFP